MQYWRFASVGSASLHDNSVVVKEYKEEIEALKKEKNAIAKKLGEVIAKRDWAVGKLQSLNFR